MYKIEFPKHLSLDCLDHYTLIVEDAKSTANFYKNILGFDLISEIPLNTGTVKQPECDMLNFLLRLPGKEEQICVITQGLNEQTMFYRYIQKYGVGVHHVAYRTKDIEQSFSACIGSNIVLTSEKIIIDPIFGLKQFFIDRMYSGVFIEILQRCESKVQIKFTPQNMIQLANTMEKFV